VSDELDLVARMRRGDERAFHQFFDVYASRLGAFVARRSSLDVAAIEDVVQMTLINAIRGLATFRGESALFTWLCQICRNVLADVRRKTAARPKTQSLDELAEERPLAAIVELTDFRDPLDECETDSTRGAVRRVINKLPARYARVLELRFGDELTVPEISRALQMTEDGAESLLTRARQAFRAAWSEQLEGEGAAATSGAGDRP
jgi:RNA polymerase sigma-70 factor, ECF subfamily